MVVVLLSPAKTLSWEPAPPGLPYAMPHLLPRSDTIAKLMKGKSVADLKSLLSVSPALATLNHERYQNFALSDSVADKKGELRPAAFAYDGPAFLGLEAETLSQSDLEHGQSVLCILSGLYGVVHPLDLIQPYRLEMGTKVELEGEKCALSDFWRGDITEHICQLLNEQQRSAGDKPPPPQIVVNAASQEYARAVDVKALRDTGVQVIDCTFHDDGRTVSVLAKRTRGLMARHIIQSRAASVDDIKAFSLEGYAFAEARSTPENLVFERSKEARLSAVPATRRGGAKEAPAPKPSSSSDSSKQKAKKAKTGRAEGDVEPPAKPVRKRSKH
ncbi:hypothetical protein JKP88DRAFT_261307 [Tribonema minus]|uniref:Uncharacterized protein n=1 Tax=Tribonema minus TaxID=303371 RepID=A0A835YNT5_9STRA|nr:hypothetical protein JKP88DRAFT_261307 [Tribonema minus]